MRVHIPTQLRSYTGGEDTVEAEGEDLLDLVNALDRRYPGLKFRIIDEQEQIRPHIKLFVSRDLARDLGQRLGPNDEVHILGALSGG